MCSVLLSEIINTYMHCVAMKEYIYDTYNGIKPNSFDFKKNYRLTKHYQDNFRVVCDNIKSYHSYIEPLNDDFIDLKPFQILKKCPDSLDFNDYFYYLLCKKISNTKPVSIITNDQDFKFEEVSIITGSQVLKDLRTFVVN